jgi:hypothetical protein
MEGEIEMNVNLLGAFIKRVASHVQRGGRLTRVSV